MIGSSVVQWSRLHDVEAGEAWNALPQSGPWDTVFGSSSFLKAIEATTDFAISQVTVSDEKGRTAAARIAVRSRLGVSYCVVPPFTAYSALRLSDTPTESEVHARSSVLESILEAVEQRFPAAALHLPPQVQDLRVFSWRGWSIRPLYTYRITLDPKVDPSESWSESARRIARQQFAAFEPGETDAATQARLLVDSYRRNGRKPPLSEARIISVLDALSGSDMVTTRSVRNLNTGDLDAAVTVLRSGPEAYYWMAGSRPGPAMTVLLAGLLPELALSGVEVFDFVGANTAPIAEFKRRFGGQLRTYFRATWKRGLLGQVLGRG